MKKRIIAVIAALGMLFGSTLTAADTGGEPVRTAAKEQSYEPIRPKEITHGKTGAVRENEGDRISVHKEFGRSIEADRGDREVGESDQTAAGDVYTEHSGQESVEEENAETAAEGMEYLGDWTISFYCPCASCCGQWAGGATASGVMPSAWWTAATEDLPFGTILYVDGLGTFEVQDRGTGYGWLDVFVGDHGEALNLGLQTRPVYIVR